MGLEGKKILVVDDNANNTDLLSKRLGKEGHTVLICNNGTDALKQIREKCDEIDLILLDIIMPGINGYEVLKYVKSDERYHQIPVIMLSSMDEVDSIYRCFELGADDYVTKPFDATILNVRIDSNIEKKKLRDKEKQYLTQIKEEQKKSDLLLLNILPQSIADRLKNGEMTIVDEFKDVSVLFADLVGFTKLTTEIPARKLIELLNELFSEFDTLTEKFNLEKIKTIGDSYMVVSGLPKKNKSHGILIANMSLAMQNTITNFQKKHQLKLQLRIGINSGPVSAGVIGKKKFIYDLWGDTVNVASRMESCGENGHFHVTENTQHILADTYNFEKRTMLNVSGKGSMQTYFLIGRK